MELPSQVPVMTLRSATLFPQALLPLYIFEPRYRQLLAESLRTHRLLAVAMRKPDCTRETPCQVAGIGLIRVSVDHKDGTSHLILQGITRVQLLESVQVRPYRIHRIRSLEAQETDSVRVDALVAKVRELVHRRLELGPFPFPFPAAKCQCTQGTTPRESSVKEVLRYLERLSDPEQVADLVACALLPDAGERQAILETVRLDRRFGHLVRFLMAEIRRLENDTAA
jgi:ATP-dependent Lon protease